MNLHLHLQCGKYLQKITFFNTFLTNVPILYPLKMPENVWFSRVFRGYQMVYWPEWVDQEAMFPGNLNKQKTNALQINQCLSYSES